MKQQLNEVRRFQKIAGLLKENEQPSIADAEKVAAKVEDSLEARLAQLDPEKFELLKKKVEAELARLGITADTPIKDIANKIQGQITEGEGDPKQKIANVLDGIGTGLIGSLLVPLIPVAIGSMGPGFFGGLGITLGTAALLKAAAKAISGGKVQELDGNTAGEITADDIKVGAQFKFKDPNNGEIKQIEIDKILSDWNGESVYFKYLDRGNQGPYLLGDPDKVVDFLNKSFGELTKAASQVKRD